MWEAGPRTLTPQYRIKRCPDTPEPADRERPGSFVVPSPPIASRSLVFFPKRAHWNCRAPAKRCSFLAVLSRTLGVSETTNQALGDPVNTLVCSSGLCQSPAQCCVCSWRRYTVRPGFKRGHPRQASMTLTRVSPFAPHVGTMNKPEGLHVRSASVSDMQGSNPFPWWWTFRLA